MDFSIVIPIYNESTKIAADVRAAAEFLGRHFSSGEIIVVDDGSTDDGAERARVEGLPPNVRLTILHYHPNRGKGFAVRTGMLHSQGRWVMFADSGLCIPYEDALRGLSLIKAGACELAHGSRRLPNSIIVRPHLKIRRLISKAFLRFLKVTMKVPCHLTDTQCGFKVYLGDAARELYALSIIDGFQFDVEIILRAVRKGYRILEFPVEWTADPDSRLKLSKMPFRVLSELYRIRRALRSASPSKYQGR